MADASASVERLERRLDEQMAKHAKSQKITIGIGVVLVIILIGYFSWLTAMVKDLMQPESVGDMVIAEIDTRIPQIREELTQELETRSDALLEEGVKELQAFIPKARVQLRDYAIKEFDALMVQTRAQLNAFAEYTIELHEDRVREMMQQLDSDAKIPELEETMYEVFMDPIRGSQAEADIRAYGIALLEISEKVDKLAKNEELTETERIEREILVALKELSNRSH